jgi:hypothetical protein
MLSPLGPTSLSSPLDSEGDLYGWTAVLMNLGDLFKGSVSARKTPVHGEAVACPDAWRLALPIRQEKSNQCED